MIKAYRVLAYALAIEVIVQGMAIAYAIAGLGKWVDDGGVANKALFDSKDPHFTGIGGFIVHGLNGEMLIPLITIALLVVSFFAKVPDGRRRAGILLGLVVLQVVLGVSLHGVPALAPLHVLNAFGILVMAYVAGHRAAPVHVGSVAV